MKASTAASVLPEPVAPPVDVPPRARDHEVLERLDAGDRRGAEVRLFELFCEPVLAYCARMLRDRQRGEDVCQQVFLEACRDLDRFKRQSSLRTWVIGIARHRCLDSAKARRAWDQRIDVIEPAACDATASGGSTAVESIDHGRRLSALGLCLQQLSPEVRATVLLRYQDDEMSYDELATVLDAKPGTLSRRVTRALPVLLECLRRGGWMP